MDESKVRNIINKNIRWLRYALYLNRWTIHVTYDWLPGGQVGECTADPRYFEASIIIDPSKLENKQRVLKVLRHELLHIVTCQFQTYRNAVTQLIKKRERNAIDELYDLANEQAVVNIESFLESCLGLDTEKLISLAKRTASK